MDASNIRPLYSIAKTLLKTSPSMKDEIFTAASATLGVWLPALGDGHARMVVSPISFVNKRRVVAEFGPERRGGDDSLRRAGDISEL